MLRNQICEAIRGRRVVTFLYKSERRRISPHTLYEASTGNIILAGTQGTEKEWRSFKTDAIRDFKITRDTFTPKPRSGRLYSDDHKVICSVY